VRFVALFLLAPTFLQAQQQDSYSPAADRSYPTNVYWGDTHVHSGLSYDANNSGNRSSPSLAYRFARGDVVEASNGMPARLRRPLDFLVVADHAYALGVMASVQAGDPVLRQSTVGRSLVEAYLADTPGARNRVRGEVDRVWRDMGAFNQTVWNRAVALAEDFNEPGTFTTFAGYEWTSRGSDPNGNPVGSRHRDPAAPAGIFGNLHRVVIFKDGPDKTNTIVPFSREDSFDPEDLWRFLARYEETTGGEVLAIPHNGNTSNGEMFALTTMDGQPFSTEYARTRDRWEPLYEVTQIKGDSETHPVLSPTDEFADFETWNSWAGGTYDPLGEGNNRMNCCANWDPATQPELKKAEYARSALERGLALGETLGVNPFKFGLIGSTDAHTSLPTADNDNFWGKLVPALPSATRMLGSAPTTNWEMGAAGYAAVWAEENTRESIFAAMRRKEVYASTGPRITVRFFGGWEFSSNDVDRPDFVRIGYSEGVPMGGDLSAAPAGRAPRFLIATLKDPDGANLDRVQVIKGWRDANGELQEQIYNVAVSDGRRVGRDGSVDPVGSTVDVANASYTNTIGDAQFMVFWQDPDFNPEEPAFYYVRTLEIPTPRWPAYDAKYFGVDLAAIPDEVRMVSQERVYTSPIWYTP
jgi:hypothetical protein